MPKMGVDSLKTNLTNPARTYNWDVIIPAPIGNGDTETLMARCQTTSIPGRTVGNIHLPYKQSGGIEYPGRLSYTHTLDCTFVEGEDKRIHNALYSWQQKVVHDRDGVSVGDPDLKTDILLSLISTKGEEYYRIKLRGCYVENVADVALSYEDDGVVRFTATFRYDSWEVVS